MSPVAWAAVHSKALVLLLFVITPMVMGFGVSFVMYSKSCFKRPLKNRQSKALAEP